MSSIGPLARGVQRAGAYERTHERNMERWAAQEQARWEAAHDRKKSGAVTGWAPFDRDLERLRRHRPRA